MLEFLLVSEYLLRAEALDVAQLLKGSHIEVGLIAQNHIAVGLVRHLLTGKAQHISHRQVGQRLIDALVDVVVNT